MATLVLTAVGTAIGGPLGGAIGAIVGRQADLAIGGGGSREGPRLRELTVTTSSYGQPVPRHFGRMRVAGSVIWSTELTETSSTQGGKGSPSTTSYSYSASFAVALSSTPIDRIGRIWADGTLLRGAQGDLKTGGAIRIYHGNGDEPADPLIIADKGVSAPAFRDLAYVVFEDLQLGEFGNRIPALNFEIFSRKDASVSLDDLVPQAGGTPSQSVLPNTRGFADEGGPLRRSLSAIDSVIPLTCLVADNQLRISYGQLDEGEIAVLPGRLADDTGEAGTQPLARRGSDRDREPLALRYYDEDRDFQPGVQRALGLSPGGRESVIDLPATMNADGARRIANENAHRARWHHERMVWRVAELDPQFVPGKIVKVPETTGLWRIASREWYDRGVEYTLERIAPQSGMAISSDPGSSNPAPDRAITPTLLTVSEVPPQTPDDLAQRRVFAAATSVGGGWRGAQLFVEQGDTLVELGPSGRQRSVTGQLTVPLPPSPCVLLEPLAACEITLAATDLALANTDMTGIASGNNRLLVGAEVLQFMHAEPLGNGRWRLSGLLRGRAGTEPNASRIHVAGTPILLLDDRLTPLDPALVPPLDSTRVAAIGLGDVAPVMAELQNAGLSRRPPMPVAPRRSVLPDNSWKMSWTRRARGHWRWDVQNDVPLVEEVESYEFGYGPTDTPYLTWSLPEASFTLIEAERLDLVTRFGAGDLWVRQSGTFSTSDALKVATLS